MHVPSRGRPLLGAGLVVFLLSSCAGAPKAPPTVRIVAHEFAFQLPAEVPSGPTRLMLVNQGTEIHHAELVRFAEGKGPGDVDSTVDDQGSDWAVPLGGPSGTVPGDSNAVVVTLTPGRYGILCFVPGTDGVGHYRKGMTTEFTVGAAANGATAPKADAEIHLVDYGFQDAPGALAAGKHLFRVVNDAGQAHEIVFLKVLPGHKGEEFLTWFPAMVGPPPVTIVGGISPMAPHLDVLSEVTLEKGSYLLICFVSDATDRQPHFAHGMMREVAVD